MFLAGPLRFLAALSTLALCAPSALAQTDLVAWGANLYGQVTNAPVGQGLTQVANGNSHCVGLLPNGRLISWGDDTHGKVSNTPLGNDFVMVGAGIQHSVALRANGTLVSWGRDNFGQVSQTPGGTLWKAVHAGDNVTLALDVSGQLFAWGEDAGCTVSCLPTGGGFVALGAPRSAVQSDGTIVTWGSAIEPPPTNAPKVQSVSTNGSANVALAVDGSLYAWGKSDFWGIISNLPPGNDFVEVVAGDRCALARRVDGTIVAWGANTASIITQKPTDGSYTGLPNRFMNTGIALRNTDCNGNGVPDALDVLSGFSIDCNANGMPDECELLNPSLDINQNGVLDACEPDSGLALAGGKAFEPTVSLLGLPMVPNGPAEALFPGHPDAPVVAIDVFGASASVTIPPLTAASAEDVVSDLIVRWTDATGTHESEPWPDAFTWHVPEVAYVAPPAVPHGQNTIVQITLANNVLTSGFGTAQFGDGPITAALAVVHEGQTVVTTVAPALPQPGSHGIELRLEEGGIVEYIKIDAGKIVHLPDGVNAMDRIWGDQGGGDTVEFELTGFQPTVPVDVWFGDAVVSGVPTGFLGKAQLVVDAPPSFAHGLVDVVLVQDHAQLGTKTVLSPAAWTYDPPELLTLQPSSGWQTGGAAVTIVTEGYAAGPAVVDFGGALATGTVVDGPSGQFVEVVAPPGLVAGPVDVRVSQGVYDQTMEGAFSYLPPQASALVPQLGSWFTSHTLEATVAGFDPSLPATVRIGDSAPVAATFTAQQTLQAQLPAGAVGGAGSQILFVEQGAATAVLKAAFTSLPDLASQVTGDAASGGSVAIRVRSSELGVGYVLVASQPSHGPTPIFGIHHALELDPGAGFVLGKVTLGPTVPTATYPFGAGLLQPGTKLYAQVLTAEAAHGLGTVMSFTNLIELVIP